MSIIQLTPRRAQEEEDAQDRFAARLEALSGTGQGPSAKRPSPFERVVRNQPSQQED